MKLDLLAIGVHPDDVELSCAGVIIKSINAGKKVGILDLTQGELGTRGTAQTRYDEANAAAKILGVNVRENAEMADGFFENNEANKRIIIKYIRKYQPQIVICNAVYDRHPDHGRSSKLSSDACFLSGLMKIETMLDGVAQKAWRPATVYHYIQDRHINPHFVVDISAEMERKMESIRAYKTQFHDPNSGEPDTYISSPEFLNAVKARNAELGRQIGVNYAEGFTAERYIGVEDIFHLK